MEINLKAENAQFIGLYFSPAYFRDRDIQTLTFNVSTELVRRTMEFALARLRSSVYVGSIPNKNRLTTDSIFDIAGEIWFEVRHSKVYLTIQPKNSKTNSDMISWDVTNICVPLVDKNAIIPLQLN